MAVTDLLPRLKKFQTAPVACAFWTKLMFFFYGLLFIIWFWFIYLFISFHYSCMHLKYKKYTWNKQWGEWCHLLACKCTPISLANIKDHVWEYKYCLPFSNPKLTRKLSEFSCDGWDSSVCACLRVRNSLS